MIPHNPALHCCINDGLQLHHDARTLLFAFLRSEMKFWSPLACEAILQVSAAMAERSLDLALAQRAVVGWNAMEPR